MLFQAINFSSQCTIEVDKKDFFSFERTLFPLDLLIKGSLTFLLAKTLSIKIVGEENIISPAVYQFLDFTFWLFKIHNQMKKLFYCLFFLFTFSLITSGHAQETRYFQFRTFCGGDDWRDTSFVAAATNADLINAVLSEIERPFDERKFIIGDIKAGDGGHNFNGDFRFNWHFVPDQWQLAEVAVEVCDGCPFTNVHRDTDLWLNNVGFFCPWSSKPLREITLTDVREGGKTSDIDLHVFPNPGRDVIFLQHELKTPVDIELVNIANQSIRFVPNYEEGKIEVGQYPTGIYLILIKSQGHIYTQKLVIQD